MSLWFTADWHLFHRNIIEYCGRPYPDEIAMAEDIRAKHNALVKPGDVVWHLGDVTFYRNPAWEKLIRDFHGEKHLILGNHDRKKLLRPHFESVQNEKMLIVDGVKLLLTHYPLYGHSSGAFQIHGHRHAKEPLRPKHRMLDVGVDGHGFRPWHISEVLQTVRNCQIHEIINIPDRDSDPNGLGRRG